jgi:signal transduction histidine kinase
MQFQSRILAGGNIDMTTDSDSTLLHQDHGMAEKKLARLVETCLLLSREKDHNSLLRKILFGARDIAHCAAATLFLKSERDTLVFALRTNDTSLPMGEIALYLPDGTPNERFVATWVALNNRTIQIDDVYGETGFDLSGTRKFSEESGFRTISMLVVPLSTDGSEVLGVMQLLNALDRDSNEVIPFPPDIVAYVEAIASQSAVALDKQRLLAAQQALIEQLRHAGQTLEAAVVARTKELKTTLDQLLATQKQLIQAEKLASLGQLVANIAHEINTPISAVKSSGKHIGSSIDHALQWLPQLFKILSEEDQRHFAGLLQHARTHMGEYSTREERAIRRDLRARLEAAGIEGADHKAGILVRLHAQAVWTEYLPLLRHPECVFILQTADNIASLISSSHNISLAAERVSEVVAALKSLARDASLDDVLATDVARQLEVALQGYQSLLGEGVVLVRAIEPIAQLYAVPEDVTQLWSNLIRNALQAMDYKGCLTLGLRRCGDEAVLVVSDTGVGIAKEIQGSIFDAFFSTRAAGEGRGLGLYIVQKIVEKQGGRIEFQTAMGGGTTFTVYLPYRERFDGGAGGVHAGAAEVGSK